MGKRLATTFDGNSALTRADEAALDLTGDLYIAGFFKFASVSGLQALISKSAGAPNISFVLSLGLSRLIFSVSSNGSTITSSNQSAILSAGTWYFVEAKHTNASHVVELAVTPATQASVNAFGGGGTLPGAIFNSSAGLEVGRTVSASYFSGAMHSLVLMNAIPSNELRASLFHAGVGREYWELERSERENIVAFWPLKESSGSRLDTAPLRLDLSTAGSGLGQEVRTFTRRLEHAVYGPMQLAKELLAASVAFQALVGATSESDALPFIHVEAIDDETDANTRPLAVIMSDSVSVRHETGRWSQGTIGVQIRADVDDATDDPEARSHFANRMGKILEEMQEESVDDGRLMIRSITPKLPFALSAPAETEDMYYVAEFVLTYGAEE